MLSQLVAPQQTPVSAAQMRAHSRVFLTTEDDILNEYLRAATNHVQTLLGRSLMPQQWQLKLDTFPFISSSGIFQTLPIRLPMAPVQSVDLFTYTDINGNTVPMVAGTDYLTSLQNTPPILYPLYNASWPSAARVYYDAVTIQYTAGYTDAVPVPDAILQAIRLLTAAYFEQREAVSFGLNVTALPTPIGVDLLLGPHKLWRFE